LLGLNGAGERVVRKAEVGKLRILLEIAETLGYSGVAPFSGTVFRYQPAAPRGYQTRRQTGGPCEIMPK